MEDTDQLILYDLFLARGNQPSKVCKLFKFSPRILKPHATIFGIIELETPRFRADRIATRLISSLESFYDNTLRSVNPRPPSGAPEAKVFTENYTRAISNSPASFASAKIAHEATVEFNESLFEKSIHFLNTKLVEILNQEKIIFNHDYFKILFAATAGQSIYFARYGNFETLLFHERAGAPDIIDLEDKLILEKPKTKPGKILDQIQTGALGTQDTLVFANCALRNFFDHTELKNFFTRDLARALGSLKRALLDQDTKETHALFILGNKNQKSMEEPSALGKLYNARGWLARKKEAREEKKSAPLKQSATHEKEYREALRISLVQPLLHSLKNAFQHVAFALFVFGKFLFAITTLLFGILIFQKERRKNYGRSWVKKYEIYTNSAIAQFNTLRPLSKWLLLTAVFGIFLFIQSSLLIILRLYRR